MTCADSDSAWTFCPDLNSCCCCDVGDSDVLQDSDSLQRIRVVIDELPDDTCMQCDVILDSGAGTSVLPMRFNDVGEICQEPNTTLVDAQGCPLSATRIATLQMGNLSFREKFVVANVTTPLVAFGHIIRAGWSLVQHDSGPCLLKGDNCIPVHYRKNSLRTRGSIG
eukprot:s3398_g10.t1